VLYAYGGNKAEQTPTSSPDTALTLEHAVRKMRRPKRQESPE
jgi:hypothetical protein